MLMCPTLHSLVHHLMLELLFTISTPTARLLVSYLTNPVDPPPSYLTLSTEGLLNSTLLVLLVLVGDVVSLLYSTGSCWG